MAANSPIRILDSADPGFPAAFAPLLARRETGRAELEDGVARIVEDVRQRGDMAVIEATARFDGYRPAPAELELSAAELKLSAAELDLDDDAALATAAERVRRYHAARVPDSWTESGPDEELGQLVRPLERVGLYVPGGRAPLASTLLMLAVPARAAGVKRLSVCSPGESVHPAVARAAVLARIDAFHRVGGVQAIAALAFGTESIAPVDKIAGPGNAYVQEAKRQVSGRVAVTAEAGPSEVFIVAEASAPADFAAADLLAQAEHDPLASAVLATPDRALAAEVAAELGQQLASLPAPEVPRRSLAKRGAIVVVRDLEEAFELANRYAAEHLQLFVEDAGAWLGRVQHAGAVFVGPASPVPLGDYVAGPSHVLPTGGAARFASPLGVEDFLKRTSLIRVGPAAAREIAPAAVRLARLEGLEAHARALERRLRGDSDKTG
ncbi:MAG: histidinol dehydrogenase [Proteobacteria bacterium]|nr:histidinol dehydrogenase [Pseudomonadota bacterium]